MNEPTQVEPPTRTDGRARVVRRRRRMVAAGLAQLLVLGVLAVVVSPAAFAAPPGAPANVTAEPGDGEATVDWTAPGSGGSPIIEYIITVLPDGTQVPTGSTATVFTVPGLTNDTEYTFTVRARNADGTSDPSAPSNPVTPSGTNVAPDPQGNNTLTTPEGTPLTYTVPVTNPDGDVPTYTVERQGATPPAGTVELDPATATPTSVEFTYTPTAGFTGVTQFNIRARDDFGASDFARFTVTVTATPGNDPPVASDVAATTTAGTPVSGTVPATDPDAGDVLTYAITATPASGTAVLTATTTAGVGFTYTPNADFVGNDSFVVTATDRAGASDTATVTIAVTPADTPPPTTPTTTPTTTPDTGGGDTGGGSGGGGGGTTAPPASTTPTTTPTTTPPPAGTPVQADVAVPAAPGQPVVVTITVPAGSITITIAGVTDAAGDNRVTVTPLAGLPDSVDDAGITVLRTAYDIEATGIGFSSVQVCLPYPQDEVAAAGVDESRLGLFHVRDDGVRELITDSLDTSANRICGTTTSLSPFFIGVLATERLGGANRYETAAQISAANFSPGAPVAYVATDSTYADALASGPAAARAGGPVLLTSRDALPAATATELGRLRPGSIVVLGGPAAVSEAVAGQLATYATGTVRRTGGADRYATAAEVSRSSFSTGVATAYVATGEAFPDALAGGAAAAMDEAPLLLTTRAALPAATATELARLRPGRIVVLGGSAAVSEAVAVQLAGVATVTRLAGADRYSTAATISARTPAGAAAAFVATGDNFPDALAAAPAAGRLRAPVVLVPTSGSVPAPVTAELTRLAPRRIVVLGGRLAVTSATELELARYVRNQ